MIGGADNDTYYVDSAKESSSRAPRARAIDRVYTIIDYKLGAKVEELDIDTPAT